MVWAVPERVPYHRFVLENYGDRPIVLLGVNSDAKLETARQAKIDENLPYRTWWDGHSQPDADVVAAEGPIATQWNVTGWPTIYLLDEEGVIRFVGKRGATSSRRSTTCTAKSRCVRTSPSGRHNHDRSRGKLSAPRPEIATEWGVFGWPTIFVIDEEGVLRHVDKRGGALIEAVDDLLRGKSMREYREQAEAEAEAGEEEDPAETGDADAETDSR